MTPTLILRPDLEHQRYRLTCRITIDAPLRGVKTDAWKDYARREVKRAHEQFVRDMEKQGWRYIDGQVPRVKGPFSHIDPGGIPGKPNMPKRRPGHPSIPLDEIDHVPNRDSYVQRVRGVEQHEQWDYEFTEAFTRRMLVEVPDVGPKSDLTLDEYLKRSA